MARDSQIYFRVSKVEKQFYERAAKRKSLSLSTFMREGCLRFAQDIEKPSLIRDLELLYRKHGIS